MPTDRQLDRATILESLANALRPLDSVKAFWEGGAASWDRVDEWSDLDLYVVTSDGGVDEAVRTIEATLSSLSPIRIRYAVPHPPDSGATQIFYRLEDTTPFLLIDLALLAESAPDKYLEPMVHGRTGFVFNKSDAVRIPALDKDAFVRKLRDRLGGLCGRMDLFEPFLEKERNRGHPLEALELYDNLILGSVVEVLRMRHGPFHCDFRMRYVYSELPAEALQRLEDLAFVGDAADLERKTGEARAWFDELVAATDVDEIEVRIWRG